MRIAVKEVNKPLEIIETEEKYRTDCIKNYIGKNSTAEVVRINAARTLCVGLDEDGLAKELPINYYMEINNPYYPVQKICGTTVFLRTLPVYNSGVIEDYEITNLSDDDIIQIECMLAEDYQKELQGRFKNYKNSTMVIETF